MRNNGNYGDISKLTPEEAARLKELLAEKKKNKGKLDSDKTRELVSLNVKMGFKPHPKDAAPGSPGNDFSWWNKYPELINDCANFKSNYVAGRDLADGGDIPFRVTGVVSIQMLSIYGANKDTTDPINVWSRDLYLNMFQKYRPAANYSASDLGIVIIAMVEVIATIARYERIYGVINRYSVLNVNMPETECKALGLTVAQATYLRGHLSDFRYDLNYLIMKAQKLRIMKDISLIADAISLFGYEYLDHDNPRAQIIVFDKAECGVYSDTDFTSGGSIHFLSTFPMFDFNQDNMCARLATQIDALLGSDSVQRIIADLVVWYGEGAFLQFSPIPENYVVLPVYSESILHKIHNLETRPINGDNIYTWAHPNLSTTEKAQLMAGNYIYQADDKIVTQKGFVNPNGTHSTTTHDGGQVSLSTTGTGAAIDKCHLLDTYRNDPTPEVIVEGVMFKYQADEIAASSSYSRYILSSTVYIVGKVEFWKNDGTTLPHNTMWNIQDNTTVAMTNAAVAAILDWAPLSYYVSGSVKTITGVYGDVDNVIPIHANELSKLQRTIMLSGLRTDVPVINK